MNVYDLGRDDFMMHVIVGPNSSGKTSYLLKMLDKLDSVVTNLRPGGLQDTGVYHPDRLEALAEYLIADDVFEKDGVVTIVNNFVPYQDDFKEEALKLCNVGDYLILDEPDTHLGKVCGNMLYGFMRELIPTYKECYVVTRRQCLIAEDFCVSFKVGEDGELIQIGDREAFEYVD